jgi:hypothetical protein
MPGPLRSLAPRPPQLRKLAPTLAVTPPNVRVCPECAGPVVHGSGCISCIACGWGGCS